MKTLRSLFVLFALAFMVNTASAQFSLGPAVAYNIEGSSIGIGARGAYDINDQFRPAADFVFYLEDGGTLIGFNANLHYKFSGETGDVQPYVLAGFGLVNASPKGVDASYTDSGLNLGGGITLPVGATSTFFAEGQYTIGGAELALYAGLLFNF